MSEKKVIDLEVRENNQIFHLLSGSQKYPVISNLPAIVDFPEDTLGGSEIFDVNVDDENLDSVHTFSMTVDPLEAAAMFSLHAQSKSFFSDPGDHRISDIQFSFLNFKFLFYLTLKEMRRFDEVQDASRIV